MDQNAQTEKVCNCNDEFKTHPCPVHHADIEVTRETVVTDADLVPEQTQAWVGLVFKCPKCQNPTILDPFNYCPACGVKVKIHSKKLTDIINKDINNYKNRSSH